VLYHHENIDGSGYPNGLKGEEIPMQSRIIRVVDYYDALTNPRFGRNYTQKEVIEELRKREGILFDTGYTEMLINELILQGTI
jgi:HD-GYP domain-containing protein (c-di-GMP phosphodiesterase class II)